MREEEELAVKKSAVEVRLFSEVRLNFGEVTTVKVDGANEL